MHAASGVLLVDRHIEKNGGTSFRSVLTQAERAGHCMYWGFSQNSAAWNSTVQALLRLSPEAPPPRLCIEAHSYIDYGIPWRRRLRQLVALRRVWRERSVPMKMLLTVRFRSPLDYYLSFFTWIVAARQARDGRRFGHNFSQWVAVSPNLQAEILLYSRSANTAAYCPLVHEERTAWAARWRGGDHNATARAAAAWRSLRSYDVVGTTERFDESALLVLRRLGWGEEAPPTSVPRPALVCGGALRRPPTPPPLCTPGRPQRRRDGAARLHAGRASDGEQLVVLPAGRVEARRAETHPEESVPGHGRVRRADAAVRARRLAPVPRGQPPPQRVDRRSGARFPRRAGGAQGAGRRVGRGEAGRGGAGRPQRRLPLGAPARRLRLASPPPPRRAPPAPHARRRQGGPRLGAAALFPLSGGTRRGSRRTPAAPTTRASGRTPPSRTSPLRAPASWRTRR